MQIYIGLNNLWHQLSTIFRSAEESSASNPVIHELIKRSEAELIDYERWKNSSSRDNIFQKLSGQYELWLSLPHEIDEAFVFLDTTSTKGFAIHFRETDFEKQDAKHVFDYLKERVLALGYRAQISDTRSYSQKSWVETLDRHFLKPSSSSSKGTKVNQRYGNVTIELLFRNDKVQDLKFRVNTYNGHLFHEAEDFRELMDALSR